MRVGICALRQASGHWARFPLVSGRSLIPLANRGLAGSPVPRYSRWFTSSGTRYDSAAAIEQRSNATDDRTQALRELARKLPLSCPGCGAPSQTISPTEAGHYSLTRSGVKSHVNDSSSEEDKAFDAAVKSADKGVLHQLGLGETLQDEKISRRTPICDRCHNLIHHHTGVPI